MRPQRFLEVLKSIHLLLLLVPLLHFEFVQISLDLREAIQLLVEFVLNFAIALLSNCFGICLLFVLATLAMVLFATIREDILVAEFPRISLEIR